MASVHRKKNRNINGKNTVSYEIRFMVGEDRRSYYPGSKATTKKKAEEIGRKLDALAFDATQGDTPSPAIAEWLLSLPDRQHKKLASWGLVTPRIEACKVSDAITIANWVDRYIVHGKGTRKESTEKQLEAAKDALVRFFGCERTIDTLTPNDAEDFRLWLQTKARIVKKDEPEKGLAKNTVRRRMGRCREIFNLALRRGLIDVNPFADEAVSVGSNPERQFFVPHDWIEKCIATLKPTERTQLSERKREDWRIMLAFARYAGMRSHETRLQRWEDIDIPNRQMIVRSQKNPPERVCPIFPELLPHVLRAKEMASEGAETVVAEYTPEANIGTTFEKIIKRAGLEPWPKLFQNLRATRETELMAMYAIKDVSSWLGNSAPIAMKHYAMTMKS